MSKYILLYKGPATPMDQFTPEQGEAQLKAWNEWMTKVGPALIDAGAPFGARAAISDDGTMPQPSDQNGYSIVEAPDLEGVRPLVVDHPFLTEGKGRFTIEVYELMPM
jgi:hypothetical protein